MDLEPGRDSAKAQSSDPLNHKVTVYIKNPEFLFVPPETIPQVVKDTGAIAYDAKGVELTHYKENGEERVSFDAIIKKYKLTDPALLELAKIVRGADAKIPNAPPESAGLEAAAHGFRNLAK